MRSTFLKNVGRRTGPKRRIFVLQWHITARCGEECSHCYARDSPDLEGQLKNELSFEDCIKVLDSYKRFLRTNGLVGRINLTGGDPLLRKDVFDIVKEARKRRMKVGILGNATKLDWETAVKLKEAGIFRYQVSIDGLKSTHDRLRGRIGHFDDTIRAIETLNHVGLPSVVMFTLSRENSEDLSSVAELVSDLNVRIFDFARLVPQGKGRNLAMLKPEEYRSVLEDLLDTYRILEKKGTRTHFGRKEALWNLLYLERGDLRIPTWDGLIHSGCSVGSKVLTVLADGTVYPCRRLPILVGKVPRDDIADIFFEAAEHKRLREVSNFVKCRECELLPYCRGCPGVAFGAIQDPFAPDPQCWKVINGGNVPKEVFGLKDFAIWSKRPTRQCASCDGACGGCGQVCGACSEVCASCSGCGDA